MQRQPLRIALLALAGLADGGAGARAKRSPRPLPSTTIGPSSRNICRRAKPTTQQADVYWNAVVEKRRLRNAKRRDRIAIQLADYVLTQPPLYSGPPRPIDPAAPGPEPGERPPIPLIADFLQAAAEQYGFVPQRPQSELDFKRAYAKAASAAGLTRDQIVGVYAFETGGNGTYDMQAGVSATRPRAISPAIGYNQLLSTNSVSILAEHGGRLLAALRQKAKALDRRRQARAGAQDRGAQAHDRVQPQRAGPLERARPAGQDHRRAEWAFTPPSSISISARCCRCRSSSIPSTSRAPRATARRSRAAELELMNLTGDGNGFDMVTMPQSLRERVPTANFFQQSGYERNPVARRTGTVAGLLADIEGKMTRASLVARRARSGGGVLGRGLIIDESLRRAASENLSCRNPVRKKLSAAIAPAAGIVMIHAITMPRATLQRTAEAFFAAPTPMTAAGDRVRRRYRNAELGRCEQHDRRLPVSAQKPCIGVAA